MPAHAASIPSRGPLSARQRKAIRTGWRFASGPIVARFFVLTGCWATFQRLHGPGFRCQSTLHFLNRSHDLKNAVRCKAGSPSWAPPSSEQFPPPWERCLNGLLFVTFVAVPLKFNKYYVIKKLADIFFLSLLASLILEHYANNSFYNATYRIVSRTQYQRTGH